MSLFFDQIRTHARVQFLRHLRSPALWLLALATPVAARYLVPRESADYTVIAVNRAFLELSPAVIGLQLGVLMAIILTPLAYIFLRAGPTRRQPWQAEDVTPARRSAQLLGHWAADSGALWLLMLALAIAGVILSFFRLPLSEVNPFQTVVALCLIAAPALVVVAGFRTIFSARPALRKAGGDVLFFFLWIGLITLSAAFFAGGDGASPIYDVFGFAAPLEGAVDEPITELVIGGAPQAVSETKTIAIDAMSGVLAPGFLLSRLFWIGVMGLLVFATGFVFKPRRPKWRMANSAQNTAHHAPQFTTSPIPAAPVTSGLAAALISDIKQILGGKIFLPLIGVIALAGAVLPLRGMVGPALLLVLIFPLTAHGARWQPKALRHLSGTLALGPLAQFSTRLCAGVVICALACLPAFVRIFITGETAQLQDIAAIGLALPVAAITLGHLTRGAVAGRLLLLMAWYVYLNIA